MWTRPPTPPSPKAIPQPFVKWAGGKRQLLPGLWPLLPRRLADRARYFEPFVGGGALFWALGFGRPGPCVVLADANAELIDTYVVLSDPGQAALMLGLLEARIHTYLSATPARRKAYFLATRAEDPARERAARAARFLFLNRTCFNGLYRVNLSGQFNAPHGRYRAPSWNLANLSECAARLQAMRGGAGGLSGSLLWTRACDWKETLVEAEAGDLVYLDPPYPPKSATADFTAYTAARFEWADHQRLRLEMLRLTRLGVLVVLSLADLPHVRDLYARPVEGVEPFDVRSLSARRNVAAQASSRKAVGEVVIRNHLAVAAAAPAE